MSRLCCQQSEGERFEFHTVTPAASGLKMPCKTHSKNHWLASHHNPNNSPAAQLSTTKGGIITPTHSQMRSDVVFYVCSFPSLTKPTLPHATEFTGSSRAGRGCECTACHIRSLLSVERGPIPRHTLSVPQWFSRFSSFKSWRDWAIISTRKKHCFTMVPHAQANNPLNVNTPR